MMRGRSMTKLAIAAMAGWPGMAQAHPGHEEGGSSFLSGLLHPLTGMDHLAAMLMVGLWAGIALRRHVWAPPAAFVAFMLAGFAHGLAGGTLQPAEGLIVASVLVLGLALCFAVRASLPVALSLIGLFAFAHGYAHGAELPHGAVAWRFAAGFALMTAGLHAAGLGMARIVSRPVGRVIGAAGVAGGALMLIGLG